MEENDMKQVISFFSDEEVKVVWREEFMSWCYKKHEIIIWANRPNDLAVKLATENWLKLHDIKYHRLLLDKPDNPVFVDETPSHAKFYKHHGDLGIIAGLYEEWKYDRIKQQESEH